MPTQDEIDAVIDVVAGAIGDASSIVWQPINSIPLKGGRAILLGRHGWGPVLAEWHAPSGAWVQMLGGELYGTAIPFEPTHWAYVTEVP